MSDVEDAPRPSENHDEILTAWIFIKARQHFEAMDSILLTTPTDLMSVELTTWCVMGGMIITPVCLLHWRSSNGIQSPTKLNAGWHCWLQNQRDFFAHEVQAVSLLNSLLQSKLGENI